MFLIAAKIFAIMLAGIAVSKSYVDLKGRKESLQMFLFWLITWTCISIVALFPGIVDILIGQFGGGRTGLGTFLGMGLVFLFFVVYRLYIKLERIEHTLIKTIQDMALREEWKSRK